MTLSVTHTHIHIKLPPHFKTPPHATDIYYIYIYIYIYTHIYSIYIYTHTQNCTKMVLSQLFLSFAVVSVGDISLHFQTFLLLLIVIIQ